MYQLLILVFLLNKGPQMFQCEDGSRHHFTILFNAFVFCQVFNEFNAREIGDRFDPIRSLSQSPMFLMVIFFTIMAQWIIVEFGGDFTQTYPLSWKEWRITVGMGAMSLPVGFFMRLIPVREDPATFAGVGPKTAKAKGWNVLGLLLVALVPVFVAIVYQLYWEIDEFTVH
jgi:magnesium-transporting ATPase (P-type)